MTTHMIEQLQKLTMPELVEAYNHLKPEKPAGPKTFSTKKKAIDRIIKLSDERSKEVEGLKLTETLPPQPLKLTNSKPAEEKAEKEEAAEAAQEEVAEAAQEAEKKAQSGRPIRVAAEELILKVVSEHGGRQYGMPYLEILEELKKEFPDSQTSVACLRWYAVQLRERFRGTFHKVPDRPRPAKKPTAKSE